MKEEKLQSLYYYFVSKRDRIANNDGILAEGGIVPVFDSAYPQHRDFDSPYPRYGGMTDFDSPYPRHGGMTAALGGCLVRPPLHGGMTVTDGLIPEGFNVLPINPIQPLHGQFAEPHDPIEPLHGQVAEPHVWVAQGNIVERNENEITAIGANLLQIADEYASSQPSKSAIRFEKHCLYLSPIEQIVSIPIIRSDKCVDKTNKVTWETCDKSARAGIHYVASSGEVTFEVGDTIKNIQIGILTSNDVSQDLRFTMKLSDTCGVFDPAPLMIVLKEINDIYDDEKSVFNNLDESQPHSVADVKSILSDCLNQRTFYMGLSYLCSTTDTLNVQVALAFELARMCRPKLREQIILNALGNFFAQDDIQP